MSRLFTRGTRAALCGGVLLALALGGLASKAAGVTSVGALRPATLAPDAPDPLPSAPALGVHGVPCGDGYDGIGNETCNAPNPPLIAPGIYEGLQSEPFFPSFDEDFYRVSVGAGQLLSVRITFTHAVGDLNLAIYSPACDFLVNSATLNNFEFCQYLNAGPAAEYRIVVDNNGPSCVTYTMSVTVGCEDIYDPNNTCVAPLPELGPGLYRDLWANDFFGTGDADWYRILLQRAAKITARAIYSVAPGNAEIGLLSDDCATLLDIEQSGGNLIHEVTFTNDGPDRYVRLATGHYDPGICHPYDLEIVIEGTGNLDNTALYGGWSAPIIARNDAAFSGLTTPTLDGNAPTTHARWVIRQTGPYILGTWHSHLFVDGVFSAFAIAHEPVPPADYAVNPTPLTIRGGRHTIESLSDPFFSLYETNELDNSYAVQYVWSPLVTAFQAPNVRAIPPLTGFMGYPNADGFEYTRSASYAWVVSIAARDVFDDYDLLVYDDYSGSSSGFTNLIGSSGGFLNQTDFVVGHYAETPVTVRPAAILYNPGSGGTDFAADQSDARFRNGDLTSGQVTWLDQTLAGNRLADVYEAFLAPGATYYLSLRRTAGSSDLQFAVYPGTNGGIYNRVVGAESSNPLSPDTDVLTYTAAVGGWHPVVVFRDNGSGADSPVAYDFVWSPSGYVDAGPIPGSAAELAFLGAQPNPISASARFEFSLPRPGHASIALYDAAGRLVRRVADQAFGAGRQSVAYDGHGDDGGRMSPGVYWATLRFEDRLLTRRVVQL
ncbi:MAG: FlgD immunoglobulin-like domain containing protein [Candidatus Eiseniibacteriota bacterium]